MGLTVTALAAVFALGACGSDEGSGDDETSGGAMTSEEMTEGTSEETAEEEVAVPELLDFSATTLDGESFEGASLVGKPSVLWFWYEDCHICQSQGPDVAALIEDHGADVNIVGVTGPGLSGSSTVDQMQAFVEDTGTSGAQHLQGGDGELWTRFGVTSQSTYVLLDSHGEVVDTGSFSGDELAEKTAGLM